MRRRTAISFCMALRPMNRWISLNLNKYNMRLWKEIFTIKKTTKLIQVKLQSNYSISFILVRALSKTCGQPVGLLAVVQICNIRTLYNQQIRQVNFKPSNIDHLFQAWSKKVKQTGDWDDCDVKRVAGQVVNNVLDGIEWTKRINHLMSLKSHTIQTNHSRFGRCMGKEERRNKSNFYFGSCFDEMWARKRTKSNIQLLTNLVASQRDRGRDWQQNSAWNFIKINHNRRI